MKIKADFVTNSSSTSFIFITRSKKESYLIKKLIKYGHLFNLSHDRSFHHLEAFTCDVYDVIEEIEPYIKERTKTIRSRMRDLNWIIKDIDKRLNKAKAEKHDGIYKCELQYKNEYLRRYSFFEELYKRGFTHVFEIGFGDNDGQISGSGMGSCMDYEGRHIELHADDLIIFTEQNR